MMEYDFRAMAKCVFVAILIAGFLVLTRSPFELNSGMGLLSAITIGLALFADFLLLPTLLMTLDKKDRHEKAVVTHPADSSV